MKTQWIVLSALLCASWSVTIQAKCEAPPSQDSVRCIGCGNLQENPARGLEMVYSRFLDSNELQGFVQLHGYARVVLKDPPYASPGRNYYYVLLRDPGYRRTDTVAYGILRSLSQQYGFNAIFNARGGEVGVTVGGYTSQEISSLWSRAISTGTDDWHLRLFDQNSEQIGERRIPRGRDDRFVTGNSREFTNYHRYRVRECENGDERMDRIHDGRNVFQGPPPASIWPGNGIGGGTGTSTCYFESYVDRGREHLILTCSR